MSLNNQTEQLRNKSRVKRWKQQSLDSWWSHSNRLRRDLAGRISKMVDAGNGWSGIEMAGIKQDLDR